MTTQNEKQELIVVEKRGRKFLIPTAVVSSLVLSTSAFAEGETIAYPTIDFSAIPFGVWIAAVMAFVLMAGMAFIGLGALISVLRKSRGAVR